MTGKARKWWCLFFASLLLTLSSRPTASRGDTVSVDARVELPLCTGWDPDSGTWGGKSSWSSGREGSCAKGQAAVAATQLTPSKNALSAEKTPIQIFCCPLPAGSLGEAHFETVSGDCPENSVVAGVEMRDGRFLLHCREINRQKFVLGRAERGLFVNPTEDSIEKIKTTLSPQQTDDGLSDRIAWTELPPRVRYGIGRVGIYQWVPEAILGRLPLSVLTSVRGNRDSQLLFRQLTPNEDLVSSDTKGSKQLFSQCRAVDNPFSSDASCVH